MRVLAVDVGGTNVKILLSGERTRKFRPSHAHAEGDGSVLKQLARAGIRRRGGGYPGRVVDGNLLVEPHNLARGWKGLTRSRVWVSARVMNDAAMQALGSYKDGLLLFLGLGTGLGAALVADGVVVPMELAHLPYKNSTWEGYLGVRSLEKRGRKKWQQHVETAVARLQDALAPDDIVLGGGNAKKLKQLPKGCRMGNNANAFTGGFRLFEPAAKRRAR